MIDSGSFCNSFIEEIIQTLNLIKYKLKPKILVKGISGDMT